MDNGFWFWILIFIVLPVIRSIIENSKNRNRPKIRPVKRSNKQRLPDIQVGNDPLGPDRPVIVTESVDESWRIETPIDKPIEGQWEWVDQEASTVTESDPPQFQDPPAHIQSLFEEQLAARQRRQETAGALILGEHDRRKLADLGSDRPTRSTPLSSLESGEALVVSGSSSYHQTQRRTVGPMLAGKRDLRRLLLWSELLAPPLALRQQGDPGALAGFKPAHLE